MADAPAEKAPATDEANAPASEAAPTAADSVNAPPPEAVEGPSKKAAKKAEAKAKKEAEKARRAAEREAAEKAAATKTAADDPAKAHYGAAPHVVPHSSPLPPRLHLSSLGAKTAEADSLVDTTVYVRAWVQRARMQGAKMAFLELREERNWTVQAVVAAATDGLPVSRQMVKWVAALAAESFVAVEAVVKQPLEPVKSCRVAEYELHVQRCWCVAPGPEALGLSLAVANRAISSFDETDEADGGTAAATAGVGKLSVEGKDGSGGDKAKAHDSMPSASLVTHLNNPAMHKRAPVQQAIADVRVAARKLYSEFLDSHGFVEFEPPSLIGAASEGGANVFKLSYFEREACLAQSPQFYKQIEIAGGRKRVYCIAPVFRAENSNTARHMTEFTGVDLEMEIDHSYTEVRDLIEQLHLHVFRGLKTRCAAEIATVRTAYPSEDFLLPEAGHEVRLTFAEGQKLLREEGPAEFARVSDDEDMSTQQERALGVLVRHKYKTDFFVLDKFPEGARPFYTLPDPANPTVTNAFDFFMRGQEILSGGQRLHIPAELEARIRQKGIDPAGPGIKEYVDIFRSVGVPPHGGGGIGLDRVVANFLQLPTVHLAAYYPRTPKRLLP